VYPVWWRQALQSQRTWVRVQLHPSGVLCSPTLPSSTEIRNHNRSLFYPVRAMVWIWSVPQRTSIEDLVLSLELLGSGWEVFRSLGVCPRKELWDSTQSLPLFTSQPWDEGLYSAHIPHHDACLIAGPKVTRSIDHGLKPPKLSQNKPFPLLSWWSRVFCQSDRKLNYIYMQQLRGIKCNKKVHKPTPSLIIKRWLIIQIFQNRILAYLQKF
jgi:hypothetical protein